MELDVLCQSGINPSCLGVFQKANCKSIKIRIKPSAYLNKYGWRVTI
jgi:hypothetical protein